MARQFWMQVGAVAGLLFSATIASAQSIPAALNVPKGQTYLTKVVGEGVQIYVCKVNAESKQYEWTLQAPEAKLLENGKLIGKHYGGPTWENNDGSKIVAKVKARSTAPQADAIPWLLLEVKQHEGKGEFERVNWIQRVQTVGGKAPETGCDRAHENAVTRVNYSADYLFYGEGKQQTSQRDSYDGY